jgi:hypothetical protein
MGAGTDVLTTKGTKDTKTSFFRVFRVFLGLHFGCGFVAAG